MIYLIIAGVVVGGAMLIYGGILRLLWRRRGTDNLPPGRTFVFDESDTAIALAAGVAGGAKVETIAQLDEWGFKPVGVLAEQVESIGLKLTPLATLYYAGPAKTICTARQSADRATLAYVFHPLVPAILMTGFASGLTLMTTVDVVGDPEVNWTKQSASTLGEAWLLHAATVTSWREGGHEPELVAARTAEHLMRSQTFWPAAANIFERERYLQWSLFVSAGAVFCLACGVGVALMLTGR